MLELLVNNVIMLRGVGLLVAFMLTLLLLVKCKGGLPKDGGRANVREAAAAAGKPTGSGLIFTCVFAVVAALFSLQSPENLLLILFIILSMVAGFLDDRTTGGWTPLKKGLFDLFISAGITGVTLWQDCNKINLALIGVNFTVPAWLYAILGIALVWLSINVTNCTDGVDGLSASVGSVTLVSFAIFNFRTGISSEVSYLALVFTAVLLAYLMLNANPNLLMMGDAGSRAMGTIVAVCALLSRDPFMWLFFGLVFILDGGLGIVKLAMGRYLKIKIFKSIRMPFHYHARDNLKWSVPQIVTRFTIIQIIISAFILWLI